MADRVNLPVSSGDTKQFAIIYTTDTQQIIRLVDTSDDPDDGHLSRWVIDTIGPGQTMEVFPCSQFIFASKVMGGIMPKDVSPFIGKGTVVTVVTADSVPYPNAMLTPIPLTADQIAKQQQNTITRKALRSNSKII